MALSPAAAAAAGALAASLLLVLSMRPAPDAAPPVLPPPHNNNASDAAAAVDAAAAAVAALRDDVAGIRRTAADWDNATAELAALRGSVREMKQAVLALGPPTPAPTPAPPDCGQARATGVPDCNMIGGCQLPQLNWTVEGADGHRTDQYGVPLQWDTGQWGEWTHKPRVACLVNNHVSMRREREDIAKAWGRHCDGLHFFLSSAAKSEVEEKNMTDPRWRFIFLDMKRADNFGDAQCSRYENKWEKGWRLWVHVAAQMLSDYDWFVKTHPEAFVSVPNLRRFVQWYDPKGPAYFGHVALHRWIEENIAFNLGTYVLSGGAVRRLRHVLREIRTTHVDGYRWGHHCVDRPGPGEDPTISICLRAAGVVPMNTFDRRLRQRFLPFRYADHHNDLTYPVGRSKKQIWDDYYWSGKPRRMGTLKNCCADEVIAAHGYAGVLGRAEWPRMERLHADGSHPAEVPPLPQCFVFDEEMVQARAFDAHRNMLQPLSPHVKDQLLYRQPGLECPREPDWSAFDPVEQVR